ncbi:hypothetical protein M430DRAFT_133496 [Amorphotheca resinae ATCC 22711]|uniref:Uncharacterized protein n=1 Tax=Amorphotheca resinae ATCC 22711 TaxID=857342 RepID=A0A2T3BAE2_AMORE|nr:hypothetical protein M430DRAFT_133496 [Amorphotheca resinae ATCC 22711]PSS25234.1 hypothetical protein M430DRAFT_133496 [Amorphotheca resinae ATCC 22711]
MAPIRVGFIGLSKSGWAPGAHLPYLTANKEYEIVAICNSSVQSSQEAIKLYSLPASTAAYSHPEEIANDPNVDLVVCSVRVDRHFPTIAPSLKAGKDVYVEWPLGKSAAEARELLRLKNEGGVKKAVVGLQAGQSLAVQLVKKLIEEGRIGTVLNSTWVSAAINGGDTVSEPYEYLGQKEVGGNLVTIHFAHSLEAVQQVLGYGFEKHNSIIANRRPFVKLLNSEGKVVDEKHPKTADDTIFFSGIIKGSGVPFSFSLRGGTPFKNTPGLEWRIYGSKAEIRVTAPNPFLQIGLPDTKVEIHDFAKDTVEEVPFPKDEFEDFAVPARNVSRVYQKFAKGEIICSFEEAVQRHEFIEELYKENGYLHG